MTLKEYDEYCSKDLKKKIPDIKNKDLLRNVGGCIYDFSIDPKGKLRPSVHGLGYIDTDLGGINVLLSEYFYYFGNKPIDLPKKFHLIIKSNQ